jgi:hypothetical protein
MRRSGEFNILVASKTRVARRKPFAAACKIERDNAEQGNAQQRDERRESSARSETLDGTRGALFRWVRSLHSEKG